MTVLKCPKCGAPMFLARKSISNSKGAQHTTYVCSKGHMFIERSPFSWKYVGGNGLHTLKNLVNLSKKIYNDSPCQKKGD